MSTAGFQARYDVPQKVATNDNYHHDPIRSSGDGDDYSYRSKSNEIMDGQGDGQDHDNNYKYIACRDIKSRIMTFPKAVLSQTIQQIAQFNDIQQLYYYLAWTCKMQIIDGEFMEYSFKCGQYAEIALFNAELHDDYNNDNDPLYVVAVLNDGNKSKWRMSGFMTSAEIYNIYGINGNDLPIGSRDKHNSFKSQINNHYKRLNGKTIEIKNWHKIPMKYSQKSSKFIKPNYNDFDLNKAISESIEKINNNSGLPLIPILTVDTRNKRIYCDPLIPLKLSSDNKWIAISYKTLTHSPYKTVVTGLYIDSMDIINKAALVNTDAIYQYQWLLNDDCSNINNMNKACIIQSLQEKLNEALKRETMLVQYLQQKDQQIQNIKAFKPYLGPTVVVIKPVIPCNNVSLHVNNINYTSQTMAAPAV